MIIGETHVPISPDHATTRRLIPLLLLHMVYTKLCKGKSTTQRRLKVKVPKGEK